MALHEASTSVEKKINPVSLADSDSVDGFVRKVANELGISGRLNSTTPQELFSPGVYEWLDYAFENGTPEERAAIQLDPSKEKDKDAREDVETTVMLGGSKLYSEYNSGAKPLVLIVHLIGRRTHAVGVRKKTTDVFYSEGNLFRPSDEDIAQLGMVEDGCHGFPKPVEGRKVHVWIDQNHLLNRHPLYLNGTSDIVGYLRIPNKKYIDLSERRNKDPSMDVGSIEAVGIEGLCKQPYRR